LTEVEWDRCTQPQKMLLALRASGRASDRKLRLFAAACCRRIWPHLRDKRSRRVVEVSEEYADGRTTRRKLNAAWDRADMAAEGIHLSGAGDVDQSPSQAAAALRPDLDAALVAELAAATPGAIARGAAYERIWQTPGKGSKERWAEDDAVRRAAEAEEGQAQANLLRDIFGSPFRDPPPIPPGVFVWQEGTIIRMATAIYYERDLPSGHLGPQRLAVLADALEDAGCQDAGLLEHLRGGGVHVRGCFAVDLVLGRL
jgi:hypothetical protein